MINLLSRPQGTEDALSLIAFIRNAVQIEKAIKELDKFMASYNEQVEKFNADVASLTARTADVEAREAKLVNDEEAFKAKCSKWELMAADKSGQLAETSLTVANRKKEVDAQAKETAKKEAFLNEQLSVIDVQIKAANAKMEQALALKQEYETRLDALKKVIN